MRRWRASARMVTDGRGAIAARYYFLDAYCPGCRQLKQVDLRQLRRHERTTLYSLIPLLSCTNCGPNPPFARLVKLSTDEWMSENRPLDMPKRRPERREPPKRPRLSRSR